MMAAEGQPSGRWEESRKPPERPAGSCVGCESWGENVMALLTPRGPNPETTPIKRPGGQFYVASSTAASSPTTSNYELNHGSQPTRECQGLHHGASRRLDLEGEGNGEGPWNGRGMEERGRQRGGRLPNGRTLSRPPRSVEISDREHIREYTWQPLATTSAPRGAVSPQMEEWEGEDPEEPVDPWVYSDEDWLSDDAYPRPPPDAERRNPTRQAGAAGADAGTDATAAADAAQRPRPLRTPNVTPPETPPAISPGRSPVETPGTPETLASPTSVAVQALDRMGTRANQAENTANAESDELLDGESRQHPLKPGPLPSPPLSLMTTPRGDDGKTPQFERVKTSRYELEKLRQSLHSFEIQRHVALAATKGGVYRDGLLLPMKLPLLEYLKQVPSFLRLEPDPFGRFIHDKLPESIDVRLHCFITAVYAPLLFTKFGQGILEAWIVLCQVLFVALWSWDTNHHRPWDSLCVPYCLWIIFFSFVLTGMNGVFMVPTMIFMMCAGVFVADYGYNGDLPEDLAVGSVLFFSVVGGSAASVVLAAWKLKNNSKPKQAGVLVAGRVIPNRIQLSPHEYLASIPLQAFYEWLFSPFNLLVHLVLSQYGMEVCRITPNWYQNMELLLKVARYMPVERYDPPEGERVQDGDFLVATTRMLRVFENAFRFPAGELGLFLSPPNKLIERGHMCHFGQLPSGVYFNGEVHNTLNFHKEQDEYDENLAKVSWEPS